MRKLVLIFKDYNNLIYNKQGNNLQILIVGGGISASYLASNILAKSQDVQITILSDEQYLPYDRIHLCSIVSCEKNENELKLDIPSVVDIKLNEKVVSVNTESKTVNTTNNIYSYDKLIIATGSRPKSIFKDNFSNVATFRSIGDSRKIAGGIGNKNVVIFGSGPIGLEILDVLKVMKEPKHIYLICRGKNLYSKDLAPDLVDFIHKTYSGGKITISFDDEIVGYDTDYEEIATIKTRNHVIKNPFIIQGVGIEPNIEFARKTLETSNGILVDDDMQTSAKDVYCVGEASELRQSGFIARRVKECTLEANVAIASIFGETARFEVDISIETLKVKDFELTDIGSVDYKADSSNETMIVKQKDSLSQFVINQSGELVKFIGINVNLDFSYIKNVIKSKKKFDLADILQNSKDDKLVCSCTNMYKNDLIKLIQENEVTDFGDLGNYTQTGRVCGRCKQDVFEIVKTYAAKEKTSTPKIDKKLELAKKRIEKFNALHPQNKIDIESFDKALDGFELKKEYNKWISMLTANLRLHPSFESTVSKGIKNLNKIPVIWLELADCSGNSESFIKSNSPTVSELILDYISLDYHELLMYSSGDDSESYLDEVIKKYKKEYILIVEGAVPMGLDGKFLRIGRHGESGLELLKRCANDAKAVLSVGSCAYDGGVVAIEPNPTGAVGVSEALQRDDIINLPGCPTNPINIVGTLVYFLMFEELPELDAKNRPLWAYRYRVHDNCERRGHYELGEFVTEWGDEGAKKGWCLFKMGCKGPYADLNCSLMKFNDGSSWPVQAGHGCFACGQGKIAFELYANQRELPTAEGQK